MGKSIGRRQQRRCLHDLKGGVETICSNRSAFLAVMLDGELVTWGRTPYADDGPLGRALLSTWWNADLMEAPYLLYHPMGELSDDG